MQYSKTQYPLVDIETVKELAKTNYIVYVIYDLPDCEPIDYDDEIWDEPEYLEIQVMSKDYTQTQIMEVLADKGVKEQLLNLWRSSNNVYC